MFTYLIFKLLILKYLQFELLRFLAFSAAFKILNRTLDLTVSEISNSFNLEDYDLASLLSHGDF